MERKRTPVKGFYKSYVSGIIRAVVVALLILLQFAFIFFLAFRLSSFGVYIYVLMEIGALITTIGLVNKQASTSAKMFWMMIIVLVPIAGLIMYALWGRTRGTKRIRANNLSYISNITAQDPPSWSCGEAFSAEFPDQVKLARLGENSGFSLTGGNRITYFDSGEGAFEELLADMESAEHYIFMSFFIVASGALWEKTKPILVGKAEQGVEIRFLYDDFGSMFRTDDTFWKEIEEAGVKTARFNRITKYLSKLYMNYRDHQKIVVVDGRVGYTGGFNLADEYINAIERFGYWKDGGVKIEGPAAFSLAETFLGMWDMTVGEKETDIVRLRPAYCGGGDGFCQIIADGPENNPDNPILDMICRMINEAEDFLYISTPYLVIEESLQDEIIRAAKSGVDVRLVTPGIPDKKMVNQLTKYNYGRLIAGGVRVYEYTPGFIHIKNFVTRDCALIGTINLDYRSLFLHYECGAMIWDRKLVGEAKADFENIFAVSHEVSYEEWKNRPLHQKIWQRILNLIASEV